MALFVRMKDRTRCSTSAGHFCFGSWRCNISASLWKILFRQLSLRSRIKEISIPPTDYVFHFRRDHFSATLLPSLPDTLGKLCIPFSTLIEYSSWLFNFAAAYWPSLFRCSNVCRVFLSELRNAIRHVRTPSERCEHYRWTGFATAFTAAGVARNHFEIPQLLYWIFVQKPSNN